jgi:beta-galactosidase/beta-glucuronidase
MTNSIFEVRHQVHLLTAAQAEIWFTVIAQQVTPTTEVRGRVVGPRCAARTTIEVAYPLQHIPFPPEETPALTVRAVIPEPSLWEPDTPFTYRAHVELWQDGKPCSDTAFDIGLRMREASGRCEPAG